MIGPFFRVVKNADLGLEYELFGQAPVQALGTLCGREFYFRSRHDEWTFEMADENGDLPSDRGGTTVFYRSEVQPDASYLPLYEAEQIISTLAREYLASNRPSETS